MAEENMDVIDVHYLRPGDHFRINLHAGTVEFTKTSDGYQNEQCVDLGTITGCVWVTQSLAVMRRPKKQKEEPLPRGKIYHSPKAED